MNRDRKLANLRVFDKRNKLGLGKRNCSCFVLNIMARFNLCCFRLLHPFVPDVNTVLKYNHFYQFLGEIKFF